MCRGLLLIYRAIRKWMIKESQVIRCTINLEVYDKYLNKAHNVCLDICYIPKSRSNICLEPPK